MRGRDPSRAGLLRRDPLPLGRRGAGPEAGSANMAAFPVDDLDAIIVNAAGCGAMLKDYAPHPARRRT